MTPEMPLSIADRPRTAAGSAAPAPLPLDAVHDGFVRLRRREQSRLWFRMTDLAAPVATRPTVETAATTSTSAQAADRPGTDRLVSELVRVVRETGPLRMPEAAEATSNGSWSDASFAVEPTAPRVLTSPPVTETEALAAANEAGAAWRAVQAGAPVLLLSAGPVLEIGRPGPILGPGMRYRISGMTGSVVALEVMHANGDTRSGYANAVDLRCIDPTLQAGEFRSDKGLTGRLRMTKLATTTFGLFGG